MDKQIQQKTKPDDYQKKRKKKKKNEVCLSKLAKRAHVCGAIVCNILPWTKKRTILEIRGEKNAVPRVISCSIRRDQRRAKVADSRGSDLRCADRACSSMISHVEQRSFRRESRWWFFFLARVVVVPRVCTHSYNMCMSCEHAYTCIRQKHFPLKKILGMHACAQKHTCTQLRLFPLNIKKNLHGAYAHKHLKKKEKKKKKKKKKKNSSFPQKNTWPAFTCRHTSVRAHSPTTSQIPILQHHKFFVFKHKSRSLRIWHTCL